MSFYDVDIISHSI